MENTEDTDKGEEYPESPIQIEVTEDKPEETEEDASKTVQEESIQDENEEQQVESTSDEDGEGPREVASGGLKVPDFDIRRESTLKQLDQKHGWLDAVEEKCRNIETAFISKIQYVAVCNHYQKYLDKLSSDDESVIQFRTEFASLFEKFQMVFAGSQQMQYKSTEIRSRKNITDAENRYVKIKLEDKDRKIEELRDNLDSLHNDFLAIEKEKISLQQLFIEFSNAKGDSSLKEDEDADRKPKFAPDDEEVDAKVRQLEEQMELLKSEFDFIQQREVKYLKKIKQDESKQASLQKELNSVKYDLQRQSTRAEKAEATVMENATELKSKNAAIKGLGNEKKQLSSDLETAKKESRRLLKDFRKCQKDLDASALVVEKAKRDLDNREDRVKILVAQKESITIELDNKQAEVHTLKGDIANVTKEKNSQSRRLSLVEEKCAEAEMKLESAKNENSTQQKELDLIRKELEESDSKTRDLTKQKDALKEDAMKLEKTIIELQNESKKFRKLCSDLGEELKESNCFALSLQDAIKILERTVENMTRQEKKLLGTISDLRGEIKGLELQISGMKKVEGNLRQQLSDEQMKCKLLADDERHFRKLLIESRHEFEQLCEQKILLNKHIEKLQNENQNYHDQLKKLDSKINQLTEHLGNTRESHKQEVKNSEELTVKLKRKDDQEQLFLRSMAEKDNSVFTLKRMVKNLTEEKNILDSKLIEKNKQISGLKESARLLRQEITTLDRSVNARIDDIMILKNQVAQMNRNNALMNEQVEFIGVTRQELTNTQNKLFEEELKSKALEGEVQRPINLHRWRILEGRDPDRAQLVSKNQALQKQLVKRTAELETKDVQIQEKDKHLLELQEYIKKLTETNFQEQLWTCRKELKARTERLKVLSFENSTFLNLNQKYEMEIMMLRDQVRKYKVAEFNTRPTKKRAL